MILLILENMTGLCKKKECLLISKSNYCRILLFLELKLGCLLLFSLTSKALTIVFQARGVIVYGSDQEVRCWKSLFVCLYGFIGTGGYHVMTSGKAQIIKGHVE